MAPYSILPRLIFLHGVYQGLTIAIIQSIRYNCYMFGRTDCFWYSVSVHLLMPGTFVTFFSLPSLHSLSFSFFHGLRTILGTSRCTIKICRSVDKYSYKSVHRQVYILLMYSYDCLMYSIVFNREMDILHK